MVGIGIAKAAENVQRAVTLKLLDAHHQVRLKLVQSIVAEIRILNPEADQTALDATIDAFAAPPPFFRILECNDDQSFCVCTGKPSCDTLKAICGVAICGDDLCSGFECQVGPAPEGS